MVRNNTSKRKNSRRSATNKQSNASRWPWFVGGLACGIALSLVVDFRSLTEKSVDAFPLDTPKQKAAQAVKPRFDFYTLLRESEVIVADTDEPAEDIPAPVETIEGVIKTQQQPTETYVLQVGSFKNAADADSLRAGLLLLNLHASIEKVSPRPGETWHRVLVGPMTTRAEVAGARKKLSSNKIDSLLLKRSQ